MSPEDRAFCDKLQALCESHSINEFALYGRCAKAVAPDGELLAGDRFMWVSGDKPIVAEEAAYHFDRIANGHPS